MQTYPYDGLARRRPRHATSGDEEVSPISRGFHGRRSPAAEEGRVPPGQYVTRDFPVLSAGPTPRTRLEDWSFSIKQDDQVLKSWTWPEMRALPASTVTVDIHCVTKWSKLDTSWDVVSLDDLLAAAGHDASYVLAFCDGGYTTNLPARRCHWRAGLACIRLRRRAAAA